MPILRKEEFLNSKTFPPERERRRIEDMNKWFQLSNGNYISLVDRDDRPFYRRIKFNMFRVIMNFWRDAVIPTDPIITYEGDLRVQDINDQALPSIINSGKLVTQNMVRYGCGVFINRQLWNPQSVDPRYWFPWVTAWDESEILGNIVSYPYSESPHNQTNPDSLAVYQFEKGNCQLDIYGFSGASIRDIKKRLGNTPCGENPITPVYMNEHRIFGRSDFIDIIPSVEEMMRRESGISRALDRHQNPHLAVPEGSFQYDDNKQVTLNDDGMIIPMPEGGSAPSYVSWNTKFTDHADAGRRAMYRALQLSGIAPFLIDKDEKSKAGYPASGVSLRRLAMPTVNKLNSMRLLLGEAIKDTIVSVSYTHLTLPTKRIV